MFVERYAFAVNTSDLRDDEFHHATDALVASAIADMTGSGAVLGSLLARVKYADGTIHKLFESGTTNLAALLRIWTRTVTEKGRSRGWVTIKAEWDVVAAHKLYEHVARASLAYWMDPNCEACNGARVTPDRRNCLCCHGSGRATIQESKRFVAERIADMVSELDGLFLTHSTRAAKMLRRCGE